MGPMPGPPPPWGMQNVLWRLRWQTSAPIQPGLVRPTCTVREIISSKLETTHKGEQKHKFDDFSQTENIDNLGM